MTQLKLILERCEEAMGTSKYNAIFKDMLRKIDEANCELFGFQHTIPRSVHRKSNNGKCDILLYNHADKDRLEILWDLFHEFGHHQDQRKVTNEDRRNDEIALDRERTAWEYADTHFFDYSELKEHQKHYQHYRAKCLASYFEKQ